MQYPSRELRAGLSRKGLDVTNDRSHYYVRVVLASGMHTKIKSKVGGHSQRKYKDLRDFYLGEIANKLHFESKEQLIEYSECTFDRRDYEVMLAREGYIELPPNNKTKSRGPKSK